MNGSIRCAAGLLVLALTGSAAMASPAGDVRSLLEQGKAAEAYELGARHPDLFGQPEFDFFFGIAAIASGRAGEGVLALERYVVNAPDNINGRLELGRGYFVLGEDARARQEFARVLAANPPAEVIANVQRFLDAIRAREVIYRPSAGMYVEAGLGYDSNANAGVSGTAITRWSLPFQVDPVGAKRSDDFYSLGAGFVVSKPFRPGVFGTLAGGFDGRYHGTYDVLDQQTLRLDGGLTWVKAKNLWRAGIGFATLRVESDRYRDAWTLNGEWHRQLDELRSFSLFAQYADFAYAGGNSVRDSDLTVVGAGYRQALMARMQPLLSASAYVGREDVRGALRPDLSRDLIGVRVALSLTPAPKWGLSAGWSYQDSSFDGGAPAPLPGLPAEPTRGDTYSAFDVGVTYALTRNVTLKGELLISRNDSNDALADYKRDVVGVKVRYEFK